MYTYGVQLKGSRHRLFKYEADVEVDGTAITTRSIVEPPASFIFFLLLEVPDISSNAFLSLWYYHTQSPPAPPLLTWNHIFGFDISENVSLPCCFLCPCYHRELHNAKW